MTGRELLWGCVGVCVHAAITAVIGCATAPPAPPTSAVSGAQLREARAELQAGADDADRAAAAIDVAQDLLPFATCVYVVDAGAAWIHCEAP